MSYTCYGITSPINIVELPTRMNKIISNFVYLNFHPTERSEVLPEYVDTDGDGTPEEPQLVRKTQGGNYFPDRYVLLKIKNDVDTSTEDQELKDAIIVALSADDVNLSQTSLDPAVTGNVFFTQDFIHGFIRISPDNLKNEILFQRKTKDMIDASNNQNVAIKTILDYLKMNSKESAYIDTDLNDYEKMLQNLEIGDSGINILDPNTNLPITSTDVSPGSTKGDAYVSSYYVDKVFRRSKSSPAIWNISQRSVQLSELISKQTSEEKNTRKFSNMYAMLGMDEAQGITGVENQNTVFPAGELSYRHLGWHALKYVRDGENYRFDSSFLLVDTGNKEVHEKYPGASNDVGEVDGTDSYSVFKDPYVLYGKTYRYEIRDAWAIYRKDSADNLKYFVLLGTQTVNMETSCVENLPPLAPSNFSFEYVGDETIQVGWTKELKLVEGLQSFNAVEDNPNNQTAGAFYTDDVSGYLMFLRNSLDEPYQLVNQFHIRRKNIKYTKVQGTSFEITTRTEDTNVGESIIGASIPNDQIVIVSDAVNQEHLLPIRSNQDYFITFCSYDVHGNISNYSEQFFLRRNNVTGEVSTKLVSGKGASLAYPNALMPSTFILSSMKASGFKFMNIYQTPDLSSTYPSAGEGMSIHLIDLETEEDQVISSFDGTPE